MLCIVAGQRSGTTALAAALESTGLFFNHSEVFHTTSVNRVGSFWRYVRERSINLGEIMTDADASQLAQSFISHLRSNSEGKLPLLDVKLNSWQNTNGAWSYPTQQPIFMKELVQNGCAFVFVSRKSLADQIASEFIARKAQKWHFLEEEDLDEPIEMPVAHATWHARLILEAEECLHRHLMRYAKVFSVWYEDLYEHDIVNPDVREWLGEIFDGMIPADLRTPIRRNAEIKRRVISNYSEVKSEVNRICLDVGRVAIPDRPFLLHPHS